MVENLRRLGLDCLREERAARRGTRGNGLCVSEARNESAIHDGEDRALGLHGGVRGLIEDAPHLTVALRTAVTVVMHNLSAFCRYPSTTDDFDVYSAFQQAGS